MATADGSPPDAGVQPAAASGTKRPRPARKVLLCGWGAAAGEVLEELATLAKAGAAVVSCITHTKQAADCDLSVICAKFGFSCLCTDSNKEVLAETQRVAPELLVSASYRKKLPVSVLQLCEDSINFHPSLLPRHRGCWSGFWSIFDGDSETGVTCHRMVEEFDAGLILHQERMPMADDDTSASLYKKLLPVTRQCARRVFTGYFSEGSLPAGQEQQGAASYHFRSLPFDGLVQPEWTEEQVGRFIRAMHFPPFEGAAVLLDGRRIAVESVEALRSLRQQGGATAATAPGGEETSGQTASDA